MESAFDLTVAHNSTHMLFYIEALDAGEQGSSKLWLPCHVFTIAPDGTDSLHAQGASEVGWLGIGV